MRLQIISTFVAALALVAHAASADVSVTIDNGNVTVSAKDATVRQILTEWARVGQTRIINMDRVSGPPVSLELTNVPEAQALDTLLRAVSGYLAAPRAVAVPNASAYDRIFILPTSTGTPPRPAAAAPAAPAFTPPPFMPPPPQQDDQSADDEAPPRGAVPVPPNTPRGPVFNTFPQPPAQQQVPQQQQDSQPASYPVPTAPAGVSTPGMVVPAPQQPGQQPRGTNVR